MKYSQIKFLSVALIILFSVSSCNVFQVDKVTDPNNPNSQAVLHGANKSQLQNLVNGLEAANRDVAGLWRILGSFGRESYYIFSSDPRSAKVFLQYPDIAHKAEHDHSLWFGVGPTYGAPYYAVRQANLLILAVKNTDKLTKKEANGYIGFAKTIKAYQLLTPLMTQKHSNGIRISLSYNKPLKPGPFVPFDKALAKIRKIFDEGAQALKNAGSSFSFNLDAGFDGFDTPAGMLKVNRALASRAAIYAKDWKAALTALKGSFLNLDAHSRDAMWVGPANVYTGGLDLTNPLFYAKDADDAEIIVANPGFIADAEPGDQRIKNKVYKRKNPASFAYIPDDATGRPTLELNYQIWLYHSLNAPIPFIRNEELILIYAESKAQTGQLADAVDALNQIRTTWGLDPVLQNNPTKAQVIDEMLKQRRYSLWMEGHRWIDMKRYGRLDEIDTHYDGGRVPRYIARPQGELDWKCYKSGKDNC